MSPHSERPGQGGRVFDAPPRNWVDLYAPAPLRPYLRLSRADRPIGTWLLLLPCLWGQALAVLALGRGWHSSDLHLLTVCLLGAFLMRGAGCTWNDFTDRHIDAAVARTQSRPLPAGQVSPRAALLWMGLQLALSALLLATLPPLAQALGLLALAPVALYPFAKRFTWWPQAFLGIAFNWGALLAFGATAGHLALESFALYLGAIFWTLFYDTIYAHQDKEDDALIGVKSTARLFGPTTPRWLLAFLIAATLTLAFAALWASRSAPSAAPALLALAGVWAFGWHLAGQIRRLDTEDPALCLRLFRSNRDAGLWLALFLAGAAAL